MRAYAIGQGASTQAFLGLAWIALVGAEAESLLRDGLMLSAWAINMALAEILISRFRVNRRSRPPARPSSAEALP